ncbi:MAG: hypothetical protein GX662_04740 [Trichococcus flocculiformis]|uniref:Uncharacterized protein n=1 Tax=Trichococcus flocculiformis TaxID=82803 RepID=A0A847D4G6_9LACT|nr:DUF859 family phage minor structural protein [Trichococcus flocculiformis]NLD31550.1 hypothetical protein [Trichococcus flocculiformis]
MALSGSYTQGFTNNGAFRLRVVWSATQNINENYSTVWADLYLDSLQSWATVYDATSSACSITINGNTKSFSNTSTIGANESKKLGTHGVTVYHAADGTKRISVSAAHNFDITWNGAYVGNVTVSGGDWLNTIPRATTPTLSNSNPNMGDTITISLPRASSSFTHYVFHDFLAGTWTQINTTAVGTSLQWTVPLKEYAQRMQTAEKGGGRIQVDTFNGGTFIGSKIVNFTAKVPASVVPTISAGQVTHAETVTGLATKFANYVQGKSKIRATVAGTGAMVEGVATSTITGYKIQMNGQTFNTNDATSSEVLNAGTQNIIYTVTDSRGRTASRTVTISPLTYTPPILSVLSASRCEADGTPNDEGEYAKVTIGATLSALNNLNNKIFTLSKKPVTSETWTNQNVSSATYTIATTVIISGISGDNSWDIKFSVQDYFYTGDTVSKTMRLSAAFSLIDYFKGGKGLAFEKVAEKDGFENNLKTWFRGGIEAIPLPSGDNGLAYWQSLKGGFYKLTNNTLSGQPTPWGAVNVYRTVTDGIAECISYTTAERWYLRFTASGVSSWVKVQNEIPKMDIFQPTLRAGMRHYIEVGGGGFNRVKFYKTHDGMVGMTGMLYIEPAYRTHGAIICQLPVGYRPAGTIIFNQRSDSSAENSRIEIHGTGEILFASVSSSASWVSFGGIQFPAEN